MLPQVKLKKNLVINMGNVSNNYVSFKNKHHALKEIAVKICVFY